MKKLMPFFLAFAIVVCFVACKDKNEPSSVTPGTSTPQNGSSSVSSPSQDSQNSQTQNAGISNPAVENVAQTYVLTTTPDMTVPSVATTPFNPANEVVSSDPFTSQAVSTDFNLTVAPVTVPVVNTTVLPSVPTANRNGSSGSADSNASGSSSHSDKTTSSTKKQPSTTAAAAKAVSITNAGVGLDGSGKKLVYSIDPSCGSFNSNSTTISITVDGEEYDNIPCKISATNVDASGCQQIFIDLSGVDNLEGGSTVSFSVPSAFLTSRDGKTYNRSFGNTIVV